LEPNLGVVEIGGRGGQMYVLADVPGLIEGAASGAGLGHEFLRHVTRTKALIHVLDASGGLEGRDPLVDFTLINDELRDFDPALAKKSMVVALNKVDLPEARDNLPRLRAELERKKHRVFEISAATGEGVQPLLNSVAETLRELDIAAAEEAKRVAREPRVYTLEKTDERAWQVTRRSAHDFEVTGVSIERFAKMTNFDLDDAVDRFQRVLEASGISDELERQGIEDGDTVHLGGHELTWGEQTEPERPQRRTAASRKLGLIEEGAEIDLDG
jgi:GTP-binding protein